jgi:hypothetical protein
MRLLILINYPDELYLASHKRQKKYCTYFKYTTRLIGF